MESLTREDLAAKGKALRDKVSRASHASWRAGSKRADPVAVLNESNKGRIENLLPIRYGRMLQNPFAFFRGAAAIMAGDLARTPATGIRVQACGDCHLANFGGFATPERRIIFDINDFDETSPAPWEWDVKRLAASFVIAGRNNRLDRDECRNAGAAAVRAYRKRMEDLAAMPALEAWYSSLDVDSLMEMAPDDAVKDSIRKSVKKAAGKAGAELVYPKLVESISGRPRIKDNPPLIFHAAEQQDPEWEEEVQQRINGYRKSLQPSTRVLFDRYHHVDTAVKVVGVGSVGTTCAVLLCVATDDDPLFLQAKEARVSVLEAYAGKSKFRNRGERVVVGQRIMQSASDIFLGWVTDPKGRHFYLRQLRDAKIKPMVELFDASYLAIFAKACGWTLARAHARSGMAGQIAGYLGKSEAFDEAMADFSEAYADQNEQDFAALQQAVLSGKIEAVMGA